MSLCRQARAGKRPVMIDSINYITCLQPHRLSQSQITSNLSFPIPILLHHFFFQHALHTCA